VDIWEISTGSAKIHLTSPISGRAVSWELTYGQSTKQYRQAHVRTEQVG